MSAPFSFAKQAPAKLKLKLKLESSSKSTASTTSTKSSAGERRSIEQIFQKKTQREHILLRPDTYVGSVQREECKDMYVLNADSTRMEQRSLTFAPALVKVFDELLVNAADNRQNDAAMTELKVEINQDEGWVSVMNNGTGIPVAMHREHDMYVPTLIFGHLLSGTNFDDTQKRTTGGRNGFGAKLANVFSTRFTVETASVAHRLRFRQTWNDNMTRVGKPSITKYTNKSGYTKVTMYPDLAKFGGGMTRLDDDIVAVMTKRVWDVAGTTDKRLRVSLNNERVPVTEFRQYCRMFLPADDDKFVYERCGVWEVAAAVSHRGFQQISFVNNISTTHGGTHVLHVLEKLYGAVRQGNPKLKTLHANLIKNNTFVMVNALAENVAFSSQTKLQLTSTAATFGSKCTLTKAFGQKLCRAGLTASVLRLVKFEAEGDAARATDGVKRTRVLDIDKLDDANDAGSPEHSRHCTLILTEGDSAKALAMSGLTVIGRDRNGVFPLKGKLINVRSASLTAALKNTEVSAIKRILGLVQGRVYTPANLHELRYGHVMIMADQDVDGSHIKGLVINLFSHFWPSLLRIPGFMREFITPIVKLSRGGVTHTFYTLPERDAWIARATADGEDVARWTSKYYKGLGTSTSAEGREYFRDLARHQIDFYHTGDDDDRHLHMFFTASETKIANMFAAPMPRLEHVAAPDAPAAAAAAAVDGPPIKASDVRKLWIERHLTSDVFLDQNTDRISYTDFVNKELILFAEAANQRAIPSLMDGFKPGQRKIWFACLKRNLTREIKVAQLAGYVSEHAAYHHGEMSLTATIVGMAQNFVGSNNLNLLVPQGQFGTRASGGKDAASGRYITTRMTTPLTTALFCRQDAPLLTYLEDDGMSVEPEWYAPVIPLVLANGTSGMGVAWSTNLVGYNPRDLIRQIRHLLADEPLERAAAAMRPWFRGFTGVVTEITKPAPASRGARAGADERFVCTEGVVAPSTEEGAGPRDLVISDLPIGMWTASFKKELLRLEIAKKIDVFGEHHTDTRVKFTVTIAASEMAAVRRVGALEYFKLTKTIPLSNTVMFDAGGALVRYPRALDVIRDFYVTRLPMFARRKAHMIRTLEYELKELTNRRRFVLAVVREELVLRLKPRAQLIAEMTSAGYWCKPSRTTSTTDVAAASSESAASSVAAAAAAGASGDVVVGVVEVGSGFDYLLSMKMSSQTLEKVQSLEAEHADKVAVLARIRATTPPDMWRADLDELERALDVYEHDLRVAEDKADADAEHDKAQKARDDAKIAADGGRVGSTAGKRKRARAGAGAKRVKKR